MVDASKIDFINRDPNRINDFLILEYTKVIAEPDGTHSGDCLWLNSAKCYYCNKGCCYKVLTFLCGLQTAIFWGCLFACLSFTTIWEWGPIIRYLSVQLHPIRKLYKIYASTFYGPIYEAIGHALSRIRVNYSEGKIRRSVYDFNLNDF